MNSLKPALTMFHAVAVLKRLLVVVLAVQEGRTSRELRRLARMRRK